MDSLIAHVTPVPLRHSFRVGDRAVALGPRERHVIQMLRTFAPQTVSLDALVEHLAKCVQAGLVQQRAGGTTTGGAYVLMHRISRKLPGRVQNVWGVGYRWIAHPEDPR